MPISHFTITFWVKRTFTPCTFSSAVPGMLAKEQKLHAVFFPDYTIPQNVVRKRLALALALALAHAAAQVGQLAKTCQKLDLKFLRNWDIIQIENLKQDFI